MHNLHLLVQGGVPGDRILRLTTILVAGIARCFAPTIAILTVCLGRAVYLSKAVAALDLTDGGRAISWFFVM